MIVVETCVTNSTRTTNNSNTSPLLIFHQNIRGLCNKIDEFYLLWSSNLPHILCFTERRLCNEEINSIYINPFNLGAKYYRINRKYGGVSIFVHETISFTSIDLSKFCNDQDIEICTVKAHLASANLCILSV
jgi:hypothetical protein